MSSLGPSRRVRGRRASKIEYQESARSGKEAWLAAGGSSDIASHEPPATRHYSSIDLITFAGTPTASDRSGMSRVTTAPAPVFEPRPTRTGATSIVSLPM